MGGCGSQLVMISSGIHHKYNINSLCDMCDILQGWADPFASPTATARERQYASQWKSKSVYTPCFVIDGQPTRQFGKSLKDISEGPNVGVLEARDLGDGSFQVTFSAGASLQRIAKVTGVILANHCQQKVLAGECARRTLQHDFVVLATAEAMLKANGQHHTAIVQLPRPPYSGSMSVAFWVSSDDSIVPVQAVGGAWQGNF